ncbi:MAG: OmpA family protein [Bacteroidetes bacterium]|nr:OmpA family protein [Bacteroidota bacterium]
MKRCISMLMFALTVSIFAYAQNDADGCKDHKLLTRLENFNISDCSENYNELQLRTSAGKTETKEGNLFFYYYRYNFDAGVKMKSPFQIVKNYENAVVKNGGRLIFKNTNGSEGDIEATLYLSTKEKEYWIQLTRFAGNGIEVEAFGLNVLEIESMKQEVVASEMFEKINKEGFIALYINFETGKSDIKPESQPIIDQLAAMLKQNPTLKVSIEGHTDNVGGDIANQQLSESRAKSVMNALISQDIDVSRFKSKGWGQSKPIADNNTEEGRAKNRRVEILKQ